MADGESAHTAPLLGRPVPSAACGEWWCFCGCGCVYFFFSVTGWLSSDRLVGARCVFNKATSPPLPQNNPSFVSRKRPSHIRTRTHSRDQLVASGAVVFPPPLAIITKTYTYGYRSHSSDARQQAGRPKGRCSGPDMHQTIAIAHEHLLAVIHLQRRDPLQRAGLVGGRSECSQAPARRHLTHLHTGYRGRERARDRQR